MSAIFPNVIGRDKSAKKANLIALMDQAYAHINSLSERSKRIKIKNLPFKKKVCKNPESWILIFMINYINKIQLKKKSVHVII